MKPITCPYCSSEAQLDSGSTIYPKHPSLRNRQFWSCPNCDAYVGCHAGTEHPLGRLANKKLRALKTDAHLSFDRLWRDSGPMSRSQAYKWLSEQLHIPSKKTHIGLFDESLCKRTIEVCDIYMGKVPVSEDTAVWLSALRDKIRSA